MSEENAAEVVEESAPSPEDTSAENQAQEPANEADESQEEQTEESTEDRKNNTVQKRIDRLTRARREAERQAQTASKESDELKKQNEELIKRLEALETRAKNEEVQRKKPVRENFYSDEEYIEALADWKYEQRTAQAPKEAPKDEKPEPPKQNQPDPAFQEVFRNVIEEGRSAYEDFEQTVLSESVPITQQMAEVALDSENAAEILYHFGKNPQKAYEIAQMSPLRMARAIAEIEQGVNQPKPSNSSNAPDPIEPVRAKKGGGKADPTKMSTEEWMKWRERQLQNQ